MRQGDTTEQQTHPTSETPDKKPGFDEESFPRFLSDSFGAFADQEFWKFAVREVAGIAAYYYREVRPDKSLRLWEELTPDEQEKRVLDDFTSRELKLADPNFSQTYDERVLRLKSLNPISRKLEQIKLDDGYTAHVVNLREQGRMMPFDDLELMVSLNVRTLPKNIHEAVQSDSIKSLDRMWDGITKRHEGKKPEANVYSQATKISAA